MKPSDDNPCLLCHALRRDVLQRDQRRRYDHCRICRLVFVPPECYLSLDEEKPSTNGTQATRAMTFWLHMVLETIQ